MTKNLFETKIKDGLWVLAIVIIIMGTSLMMDNVKGFFRQNKVTVTLYIPSWDVGSDGPSLKPGDAVKLYKMVVGRVAQVDIFVAKVLKPPWTSMGSTGTVEGGTPEAQEVLVSGLKVTAELFWGDFGPGLAMITPESRVKMESQPLGDSAVVLYVSDRGETIKNGDAVNFPQNDQQIQKAIKGTPRLGVEITNPAQVSEVLKKLKDAAPAETPASGTSGEGEEDDF